MSDFTKTRTTLIALKKYFDEVIEALEVAENDPEQLLLQPILSYEIDRDYILTNLATYFGEDGIMEFYQSYFDRIINLLSWKIPIDDVKIQPGTYNNQDVLFGVINDEKRFVINTFTKEIIHLEDAYVNVLYGKMEESQNLIAELENMLNQLSVQDDDFVFNKKKAEQEKKAQIQAVITQIGLEKQNLSDIRQSLANYNYNMGLIYDIRDKYISRLKKYYSFTVVSDSNR